MAKVMSPGSTQEELEGMEEAEKFFNTRPQFGQEMVRMFGEHVYARRSGSPKAIGFRRMAYVISTTRHLT